MVGSGCMRLRILKRYLKTLSIMQRNNKMDSREDIIVKLKGFKERVGKDFPIKRMIFFGSMATGKATKDSDIDLIIVSDRFKDMNFIRRAAKMYNYWDLTYPVVFYAIHQKNLKIYLGEYDCTRGSG